MNNLTKLVLVFILIFVENSCFSQADPPENKPNLIFNGIYTDIIHHRNVTSGLSPYELYDGFKITKVIEGNINVSFIRLEPNYIINLKVPLKKDQEYQVSLMLNSNEIEELRTKQEDPQYFFIIRKDNIKKNIPMKNNRDTEDY